MAGGKKAVLIGCNYPGTENELQGCVTDVIRMYEFLVSKYGFVDEDILILIDTDESSILPTGVHIRYALHALVQSAEPGDCLFVHFSGHGGRSVADADDNTGYDEYIVPCDDDIIKDDEFRQLVDGVPEGSYITIVADSCHSGGLIDGAKEQIGESTWRRNQEEESSRLEGRFGFRSFLKQTVQEALEKRGIHIEFDRHHRRHEVDYYGRGNVKNRSLPHSSLVKLLKQKSVNNTIDEGHLRIILDKMFGDHDSPKAKRFMSSIASKLHASSGGGYPEVRRGDGSSYTFNIHEAYACSPARAKYGLLRDKGILISACQTHETAEDRNPNCRPGDGFGTLTNAILTILSWEGNVSNRELVLGARKLLADHGCVQKPGLYCSDYYVDYAFICPI